MASTLFNAGGHIQVQYELFRAKAEPELVWYNGTIVCLQMQPGSKLKITVRFEQSATFDECEETFIAGDDEMLVQRGREFPFKLIDVPLGDEKRTFNQEDNTVGCPTANIHQVLNTIAALERRIIALENASPTTAPPIYMTLCSMLNKSLNKFRNARHKLQRGTEEVFSSTWKISQSCTYNDFKLLLAYLRAISESLKVDGDVEGTTAATYTSITVPSFKIFCTLFGIAENTYKSLLSCHHLNRKGQLLSFKCIGTIVKKTEKPSLPSILSVGGNAAIWCDWNYFFMKENSHILNTGTAACEYERLLTRQIHTSQLHSLGDVNGCDLTITWSMDESTEICRPIQAGVQFIGKLIISLPYIIFNDEKVATKLYKWLRPKRTASDSSDSSSSSS